MPLRRTAAAAALVALVAVPGCGTGDDAQTLKNRSTTNGPNADLQGGEVQLRNVYATPSTPGLTEVPVGGDLDLHFHVYNRTDEPETLVQITSPSASAVRLSGTDASSGPLVIGPQRDVWVGGPVTGPVAQLSSINVSRFTGTSVPVTFSFRGAGSVTLDVPIEESVATAA